MKPPVSCIICGMEKQIHMDKIVCLALLLSVSCATFAADSLRETFRSPQGAARENTGPLFWMHGTETPERLREYVGRVDESGQGVLTIESRPHVDWMRDGWWRDVDIVLDACRKRGMKMMVFDDYWWPSQGMGGKYPIPEKFQCRDVKGSVYPIREVPAKAENEVARVRVREVGTNAFELAANGDRMIVYAWFTSKGGYRFPTVNGLDEEAVDWFIANYYQPYYDRYKESFADGTIPGFFFDEPQFRSWWGPALAQELAARGDDAGELLTALKFKLADADDQSRALYRYLDARAEVWGRTMYGRQSDWCRKRGVYSSGHFHVLHLLQHVAAGEDGAVVVVGVLEEVSARIHAVLPAPVALAAVHRAPPRLRAGIVVAVEGAGLRLGIGEFELERRQQFARIVAARLQLLRERRAPP